MKFIWSIFVAGALLGLTKADDVACQTKGCKSLAEDLMQRSMNLTADPCNDFNEFVCGNWAKHHPLPDSVSRQSYFNLVNDHVIHAVSGAMADAATKSKSHAVSYLVDMFHECNNTATRQQRGMKPLVDIITQVVGEAPIFGKNVPTTNGWQDLYGKLVSTTGLSPAIRFTVQFNRQTFKKILLLVPGNIGISANVYVQPSLYAKQMAAYKQYMHDAFVMLGAPRDAHLEKNIEKIINFEKNIAMAAAKSPFNFAMIQTFERIHLEFGQDVDLKIVLNNILKDLKSTQKPFGDHDQLAVVNLGFLKETIDVFKTTPIEVVQNYFAWIITMTYGLATTHEFRHANAQFMSTITGIKHEVEDVKYCAQVLNAKLPFAYARAYVDAEFTKEDRDEALSMVKELKKSFSNILSSNEWLDDETKEEALKKLEKIKENIGYPDWLKADSDLDDYYEHVNNVNVQKNKFIESMAVMFARDVAREYNEYIIPYNHTRAWPMTPATVNAAYMPIENSITIPAAILNTPFFDKDRPISMNYGSIGAVIGHEMTHGFDNNGRRFDADGKQKDWWSPATASRFTTRANCFVKQYGAIHDDFAGLNINGQLTLGENIADNGGLKESWFAFQEHQKTKASQTLSGLKYSADQLFFISFGRNWCSIINRETLINQIKTNPHTPDKYRTLTVLKNSPQFAKAFNCPVDSPMNPTAKCAVW